HASRARARGRAAGAGPDEARRTLRRQGDPPAGDPRRAPRRQPGVRAPREPREDDRATPRRRPSRQRGQRPVRGAPGAARRRRDRLTSRPALRYGQLGGLDWLCQAARMLIGVLGGTGPAGQGIAARLAASGHAVILGSRERARAGTVVAELRDRWGERLARLEPGTNLRAFAAGWLAKALGIEAFAAALLTVNLRHRGRATLHLTGVQPRGEAP